MKIYVASSWRNLAQPGIVAALRALGHEVYDFKNPKPGDNGFHWSAIDGDWKQWTPNAYRRSLANPIAESGFTSDFDAMKWADSCVLVLPCGRSAHIEMGWCVGAGKRTCILMMDQQEPELMYKMVDCIATSMDELFDFAGDPEDTDELPGGGVTDAP